MSGHLLRRLGVLDLTLITIGAVIGSGIFRNPAVVAKAAHTPWSIIAAWIAGGVMAMIGAFVFAELAARRPEGGGFYAYLRDAYNPLVGFLLGWTILWIAYTGSTAASAVLFAGYIMPLLHVSFDPRIVAVVAIVAVTLINVLGVRQGSTWQNVLVALKMLGLAAVIVAGLILTHPIQSSAPALSSFHSTAGAVVAFGVAMLPVLFAYNGFQNATYMTGESRDAGRTIALGQLYGVSAVVAIYVLANVAYLHVLGANGLAVTQTPASDIMSAAFGTAGGTIVALAIAVSTLGFMSGGVLLAPRLYFQMAADGLFFKQIAWISPRTNVPVNAIALHGAISCIIAATGTFEQIVEWVTLPDWLFVMLGAIAIFIFRRRDAARPKPPVVVPGHPWTTSLLVAAILAIAVAVLISEPKNSLYGALVIVTGIVFYYVWKAVHAKTSA